MDRYIVWDGITYFEFNPPQHDPYIGIRVYENYVHINRQLPRDLVTFTLGRCTDSDEDVMRFQRLT